MSRAVLRLSPRTSLYSRTLATRVGDISYACRGTGPCVSRMATPEEMEEYNAIPLPTKKNRRNMIYKF